PAYGNTVDVMLDVDSNNDGCRERTIATDLFLDPGERWNCSNFNVLIPSDASSLIVRVHKGLGCRPEQPRFATEGPYTLACDPIGNPRSFYYGVGGAACIPWRTYR